LPPAEEVITPGLALGVARVMAVDRAAEEAGVLYPGRVMGADKVSDPARDMDVAWVEAEAWEELLTSLISQIAKQFKKKDPCCRQYFATIASMSMDLTTWLTTLTRWIGS